MFWKYKPVIVTGGAGMLGSALCELLKEQGAQVEVLDIRSIQGFGDASNFRNCLRTFKGKFAVFNLAAKVAGVEYNSKHTTTMFNANISLQTIPVLAAVQLKIPRFIQVSSVCVYAEEYQNPAVEENGWLGEPNKANAGYAWAKRMGERAALWSELPHVSIVRPTNMYGPRDHFEKEMAHVIPSLIRKCFESETLQVLGTGEEIRDFIYVSDAASALMTIVEKGGHRKIYNISGSGHVRIAHLAGLILKLTGAKAKKAEFTGNIKGDAIRMINDTKARALGWLPETTLGEGLEKTIRWFRENELPRLGLDQR